MVQRVYEAALQILPRVVVATDDMRIVDAVKSFGGEAIMTPNTCESGTERMAHVARRLPAKIYVNIQGDEPLVHPDSIRATVALAVKRKAIATPATDLEEADRNNPSAVKVVMDREGRALYFSRSMIPFIAHGVKSPAKAFKHMGIYAYPRAALLKFVSFSPTDLEQTERLEQLRALYYGLPIYVAYSPHDSIGVDTPEDLKKAEQLLKIRRQSDRDRRSIKSS